MYDCIVIGMGCAGMSSALYAKKANLNTLIIESNCPGGLLNKIKSISNYIGYEEVSGSDIALNMFNHIRNEKIEYKICKVLRIEHLSDKIVVYTTNGDYSAKGLILACGRKMNKIHIENEDKFVNKGISYCAICDGNLFLNKNVIVVGNDNYAYEDAIYLTDICSNVTIITNSDNISFDNKCNLNVINNKISSFNGGDVLESVTLSNGEKVMCDGCFICNGSGSDNAFINNLGITDEKGYIIVDEHMKTKIDNIYACGDAIKKEVYQVCTAVSEGCIAAINLNKSIKDNKNDIN